MHGVFVTGTGTEVGKSVVAAVLARSAARAGRKVGVFKPAVSGLDDYVDSGDLPDHELLRLASGTDQSDEEIAPYRYGPAVSPHLAAQLAGGAIDPARLREVARTAGERHDFLVCEGVGGLLVPLTPNYLVRDLARDLGLPTLIVAAPGLGTINHTLLTLEAVRAAGLEPACVVFTPWPAEPSELELSNRETVERLGRTRVQTLERIDLHDPQSWPRLPVDSDRLAP